MAAPIPLPAPLAAGEREELVIRPGQEFQDIQITHGTVFYFAFRSYHGQWSGISNVVFAALQHPPTPSPDPLPSENNKGRPTQPGSWTLSSDPQQRGKLIMIIAA